MNKAKLIALRNNIQNYLDKVEREDKLLNLDQNIISSTTEVVNGLYDSISRKLDEVKVAPTYDTDRLIEALQDLKKGFSIPMPKDRTDDIVNAISSIRFPEVNFPNVISVDNFPPQKIPNPVTNIKSTLVADDTGLLQDILDALGGASQADIIHQFGENNIAAGNTLVMATYTVPAGKKLTIGGVYGEGIDDGLFMLYIDATKVWQSRNAWTQRGVQAYLQYMALTGQVVEFRITNLKNATRAFSGGFYGRQVDS